ncbi:hypothetical protein ACFOYW_00275 [Gryllotalpicola reticulitermitis]|uniref:Transposase n=1 Tax=Gryllotalpicola reticulitermitis TaxID=1184153 RepID=A0ABV8Q2S3_9MICO
MTQAHDLSLEMLMALFIRRHMPDVVAEITTVAIHHRLVTASLGGEKPARQSGENTNRQDAVLVRVLVIGPHA